MQQSLSDFVAAMDKAGLLVRIKDEVRVDQLPKLMEANPTKAILVEKVKDSEFSVLANAYSNQEHVRLGAWAATRRETGLEMVERSKGRMKWEMVTTAPCKEVILKGDDVDLTRLPLFLHHDRDGHAYTNDNLFVSKHPDTGVYDWGIYRSMFRTKNEKSVDMTCTSHRQRMHAHGGGGEGAEPRGRDRARRPDARQDRRAGRRHRRHRRLRGARRLLRRPGQDGQMRDHRRDGAGQRRDRARVRADGARGPVYDEGPYGEFTGMYGGGIKHNYRLEVKAMTYRKGGIFQHCTIGGLHPWYTDNMLQLPAIEADLFNGLKHGGIDVARGALPAGRPVQHRLCQDQARWARAIPSRRWASC